MAEQKSLVGKCGDWENEYLRRNGGKLYPELENTLKKLKEQYHLYIVSNCQSGYIEAFLDYYNFWDSIFEDIECYGNNEKSKGDNIRLVMERNGLEQTIYVGDIQGDYDATMQAGVDLHSRKSMDLERSIQKLQKSRSSVTFREVAARVFQEMKA